MELNGSHDWWFVSFGSFDWDTFGSGCCSGLGRLASITVKFQELGQIETWLLQHFHLKMTRQLLKLSLGNQKTHLADVDIVQWVNSVARLLDVLGDGVRQQFVDDFLQVRAGDVTNDDVVHLLADGLDLG
jgi:hypothetical protein